MSSRWQENDPPGGSSKRRRSCRALLAATGNEQAGTASGVTSIARTLGTTLGPVAAALSWLLGATGFRLGVLTLATCATTGSVGRRAWRCACRR